MGNVRQAFIGLGANLGDRANTLRAAIEEIRGSPGIVSLACSSFYETDPVGKLDQPMFLNAVLAVETTLTPEHLLSVLLNVEKKFGRERIERWGPRTLDLDLLAFEGEARSASTLELPHPRMLERSFVVVPLREIFAHDLFRSNPAWLDLMASIEAHASSAGVRRVADEPHK